LVLYGCETQFLTLYGNNKLRVFEKKLVWRIFGPEIMEATWYIGSEGRVSQASAPPAPTGY
jgi:hypothetical protein